MKMRLPLAVGGFFLATACAWAQANFPVTPSGLKYLITEHGAGTWVRPGKVVVFHYVGSLRDGTVFADTRKTNQPTAFTVGKEKVIKGWEEGFLRLHRGDKASLVLPADLAYGDQPPPGVPPNASVRFDVELLEVKNQRLSDLLRETIAASGVAGAERQLAREEADKFANTYVSEVDLLGLVGEYVQRHQVREAALVLDAAARLYPKSGEIQRSRAELKTQANK